MRRSHKNAMKRLFFFGTQYQDTPARDRPMRELAEQGLAHIVDGQWCLTEQGRRVASGLAKGASK